MKVGAEDKKKLYAMAVLALIAVIAVVYSFLSFIGPTTPVAASIPTTGVPAQPEAANRLGRSHGRGAPPLDPTLRTDLLKNSEAAEYKGSGRNIFEEQAEIPKPERPVIRKQEETASTLPAQPPPPPPPPPIPLKFYGFANRPGQRKSIFLASGDDIFIGCEGDIVSRRYKIIHIMPTQVEIEDVLNNHRESIPLTQGAA
jgi:hypothetical protein